MDPIKVPNRRRSYTLKFKIKAVDYYRKIKNVSIAAQASGVSRTQIRAWDRDYERYVVESVGSSRYKLKLHNGRDIRKTTDAFDKKLWNWYKSQSSPVRVVDLRTKAIEFSLEVGMCEFKASPDWSIRWRKKHGIPVRVTTRKTRDFTASCILVSLITEEEKSSNNN